MKIYDQPRNVLILFLIKQTTLRYAVYDIIRIMFNLR